MNSTEKFVSVSPLAVPVDGYFDYSIPPDFHGRLHPGDMVVVPFGKRQIFAVVMSLNDKPRVKQVKDIVCRVDDFQRFPPDLMQMCLWVSKVFLCSMRSVMDTVFPFQKSMRKSGFEVGAYTKLKRRLVEMKVVNIRNETVGSGLLDGFESYKRKPSQRRALQTLLEAGGSLPMKELLEKASITLAPVKSLETDGAVIIDYMPSAMTPAGRADSFEKLHILTPEQEQVYSSLHNALNPPRHELFLLHGITGSGKTEIYMHAIAECIKQGKQALVLVPEIALGTQIIQRFLRRSIGRLAVWHSMLSLTERLFEWERIATGNVDIVIGARSAVFAPLENLGLVIVDEEQEAAYKQESHPRYHAREAVIIRARAAGCPVVLGSATPSVEIVHAVRRGKATLLHLPERIGLSVLPEMMLVDMRKVFKKRNVSAFSPQLLAALKSNLEKKEQSLVFLNHRGYSQFLQCFRCGESRVCPDCSMSMKYHKEGEKLSCHICGHHEPVPAKCPACGSSAMRLHGYGTEKVFAQLKKYFPDANIERMDRDTTSRRGEYKRIITDVEKGVIDILVGTQMIAKGLDFPGVTLVGVVSADSIINMPDFRSSERTYQLLTQVAGRAGRRESPGKVIVQTFSPGHPAIRAACAHEFDSFYDYEIEMRKAGRYPPFTRIANCVISSEDQEEAKMVAKKLSDNIRHEIEQIKTDNYLGLIGPGEAPFYKMFGKYRWISGARAESIKDLIRIVGRAYDKLDRKERRLVALDVFPASMM